jgi:hypothetical protein
VPIHGVRRVTIEKRQGWTGAVLALGDIILAVITLGAYRPTGDGDGRRLQALLATAIVVLLGFLLVGALVTGTLKL